MKKETVQNLKKLIPFVKIGIIVLVLGYVLWKLYNSWDDVAAYSDKMHFGWLGLASLFYMLAYVPCAFFWKIVLNRLGQRPGWVELFRAYYIGHLGKYTPGKAMVVLMRTGMIRGERVRTSIAAASVFFETLTMMAVGAFVAGVIILFKFQGHKDQHLLIAAALATMVISGLPIFPPFFRFFAKKIGVGKGDPEIDEKLSGIDFKTLLSGFVLMSVAWVGFGLSLWATVKGISIAPGGLAEQLPILTAAVALSVVLGFISMIPGGFGVRDWALGVLMAVYLKGVFIDSPDFDAAAAAIVIAGLQRAVSIVGELTFSAILYFAKPRKSSSVPEKKPE